MTSLLAAQDLRISITTNRRCRQRMTARVVAHGAAQRAEPSCRSPTQKCKYIKKKTSRQTQIKNEKLLSMKHHL